MKGMLATMIFVAATASADELTMVEYQDRWVYERFLAFKNIPSETLASNPDLSSHATAYGELTIMFLDRASSAEASRALAYLTLITLDGVVGEDHGCAILNKGHKVLPYLSQAQKTRQEGRCEEPEAKTKLHADVCKSKENVDRDIKLFKEKIKSGINCSEAR